MESGVLLMKLRHRSDWPLLIAPAERPIPESRWQTCCRASGTCQLLDINQTKQKNKNVPTVSKFWEPWVLFLFSFSSDEGEHNCSSPHLHSSHPRTDTHVRTHTYTHTLPNPFALVLIVYSNADPIIFIISCFHMLCFYLYFCPFLLSCGAADDLFSQFNVGDNVESDKVLK